MGMMNSLALSKGLQATQDAVAMRDTMSAAKKMVIEGELKNEQRESELAKNVMTVNGKMADSFQF